MIQVEDLTKRYGDVTAVLGVSFTAPAGRVFGLLGPNGAGKTTTLHCIVGLQVPTAGRIRVQGHDVVAAPAEAKRRLGFVPQELALYEDLTVEENLVFWGGLYGLRGRELALRVEAVLEAVGLLDRRREAVKRLSGGMKRRLNFGCGLVHRPEVLLLDEPTAGVDTQSRARLLELVRAEAARGVCVLYTTHYMEEAEQLCDELAILDHGRILAAGTLEELRRQVGEKDLVRFVGRIPPAAAAALGELEGVDVAAAGEGEVRVAVAAAPRRLPRLLERLRDAGAEIEETLVARPSLESLFLRLTGRELRE